MYKLSKFNYFVPHKGKIIYYNSFRRSNFAMTTAEHQKMRALFEDPISFSLEYPSVFDQFYQWGFFVDLYADEVAVFRYMFNRDVIFSSDYHLVLMNTPEQQFSSTSIEPIMKHIKYVLDEKGIRSICIEWRGHNVLNSFESFIRPLFIKATTYCKKLGFDLNGQIEVSMSNNAVIHNKLYHNKGVPTYVQTSQAVKRIISQYSGYSLRIRINEYPCEMVEKERFMKQFDDVAQKIIHWVWEPHAKQEKETDGKFSISYFRNLVNEQKIEINSECTKVLQAPRKNAVVIYPDKKVYMSIPLNFPHEAQIDGKLREQDGIIHWNESNREFRLSHSWIENKKCIACPHLPLLAGICPHLHTKIGQICPVSNKLIDPETVIIKEFEAKQK